MKKFKDFIIEFYETQSEFAPKFRKESEKDIAKRGNPHHTFETDRFHVKAFNDGNNRKYTVHDKKTGEHIGSIYGNRVSKSTFRVDEVTRDQNATHSKIMPEVYHGILNQGTSLMSSGSISRKAHGVWKNLAKSGRQVHLVKPEYDNKSNIKKISVVKKGTNVEPDFDKHVQKATKNMQNNATHYFVKASK